MCSYLRGNEFQKKSLNRSKLLILKDIPIFAFKLKIKRWFLAILFITGFIISGHQTGPSSSVLLKIKKDILQKGPEEFGTFFCVKF